MLDLARCSKCYSDCCIISEGANERIFVVGSNTSHVNNNAFLACICSFSVLLLLFNCGLLYVSPRFLVGEGARKWAKSKGIALAETAKEADQVFVFPAMLCLFFVSKEEYSFPFSHYLNSSSCSINFFQLIILSLDNISSF